MTVDTDAHTYDELLVILRAEWRAEPDRRADIEQTVASLRILKENLA